MEINFAEWVKSARHKVKLTQEQLAEKLSMTKANISAFENGRTTPSYLVMLKICEWCHVSLPSQPINRIGEENAVTIAPFNVANQYNIHPVNDYFSINGQLLLGKTWLTEMGINPTSCSVIYAKGSSMYPTLQNDQALLIDTNQTTLIENKIYLIARDTHELIIKRVSRDRDGHWIYISDNMDKNSFPIMFALKNDHIIGRIVWRGGTAGL
ncbi:S24 family peptidase [Utexia brackfieldae]|uniref:S24 family peptidase n=1 Tax=Utexia brackfieldae TaxID=3074108 RepID=UPI00370D273C